VFGELVRGDVYALKAPGGARGHEQDGPRFAVVLQSSDLPLSTVIVAPTSTGRMPRSFRPAVVIQAQETAVLVEAMTAIDPEHRLGARVGRLTFDELRAVDAAIRAVLDV